VFLTYQWALAASRGFRLHLSTMLFLMYDFDQLVGVAALAVDPKAPRSAFFLTSSTADYCDIVSSPANRKTVLLALLEEIKNLGISDVVFANVPSNSATLQELSRVAGSHRFYVTSRTSYNCGVVQLGGEEQRETLLQSLASKGREKRALKRLTNLGAVKVIHFTEPEQIGTSLESIVSAQISRFLASNRVSPLVGSERRTFLRHLSDLLAHSGWLKSVNWRSMDARSRGTMAFVSGGAGSGTCQLFKWSTSTSRPDHACFASWSKKARRTPLCNGWTLDWETNPTKIASPTKSGRHVTFTFRADFPGTSSVRSAKC